MIFEKHEVLRFTCGREWVDKSHIKEGEMMFTGGGWDDRGNMPKIVSVHKDRINDITRVWILGPGDSVVFDNDDF